VSATDLIQPFSFPELPVRGQLVRLDGSWRAILAEHDYPPVGTALLGQMVVLTAMLAHSIKMQGSVVLQTHGDGPLRTAMAECADRATLRGILRFHSTEDRTEEASEDATKDETESNALPANPLGKGTLAITLQPTHGTPYQGRVELRDEPFTASIERYFARSEQLPTRIRIATTADQVAGVLVQRLPTEQPAGATDSDAWQRIAQRATELSDVSLLESPTEDLLRNTFVREVIRLNPSRPLAFGCSCSNDRAANALRTMGRTEVDALIDAEGRIEVSCEFCGARYDYDAIDARLLFETHTSSDPANPLH
jgi:molecular chaperone Hsp33